MTTFPIRICLAAIAAMLLIPRAMAEPQTVYFRSADGSTEIVGYLFRPRTPPPYPAMVMLHGRGGPYSTNDNASCTVVARNTVSPCNAATLSKRHMMWGAYWSDRGFLALLPDSFGPRGKAHGFGRFTHDDPDRADVNEKTVRPLDAEGALAFLLSRGDVSGGRIYLQGWSNGASTGLNVMIRQAAQPGYRGALVLYPGCGTAALLQPTVTTAAPVAMFLGADDEEVSPALCEEVAERSRQAGTGIAVTVYPGASHDFDEPSAHRQSDSANQAALEDVLGKAFAIVQRWKN